MKRNLVKILAVLGCLALSAGFAACGGKDNSGNTDDSTAISSGIENGENSNEIHQIYDLYAANAVAGGQTPLTYEEWLASIKGEKGDQGVGIASVTMNEERQLIITLTDGTVLPPVDVPTMDSETERPAYSTDLAYIISEDNSYYSVIGRGLCADRDIVIPAMHNGLPVKEICESAFNSCDLIRSIVIPDSITSIGNGAFWDCNNLGSVYITDIAAWCNISFESDSANPLYYADNLYLNNELVTKLIIPDGVTSIADRAFVGCSNLTKIVIPEGVTSIGKYGFYDCESLTEIVIPDSVTSIGDWAFADCESLTEIVIPDGVTSIGNYAFAGCESLTEIVIPDGVTSIGDDAFAHCYNLTEIVIPDSVTSIGYNAFAYCDGLTNITVEENNTAYKSIDGNLYSKDLATLIQYAIGKTATSFTIPDGVTSIGTGAFAYCDNLTEIVIPDSVTSIGDYAFSGCYNLTEIVIPDGVTSIGDYAFHGCDNLTIYCEAESEPSGWNYYWNDSNCPVVWGYKGE